MDLHDLRQTKQVYLNERATCHRRIAEADDLRIIGEARERLDKIQLALDTNASVFALLEGYDKLAARLDSAWKGMEVLIGEVEELGGANEIIGATITLLSGRVDKEHVALAARLDALEKQAAEHERNRLIVFQ